jgi:hypothetical protein
LAARKNIAAERKGTAMSSEYFGEEKLLTKGEVARLCRVDVRTVDRWLTAGKLDCRRTPSGRVLFRRHDVLKVVSHPGNSSGNGSSHNGDS